MAVRHNTKLVGIDDACSYKVLKHPAGALPTYAGKVDIIGAQSMEMTLATDTKELRGDNTLLAADSILKDLTGKMLYGKLNFDVWAAMTPMALTDSATTPPQNAVMSRAQSDSPQ